MNNLEKYYNKFNEDKRLKTRHGQIEMAVCLHYINKYISGKEGLNILDVGAGTGAYTKVLCGMGHNVCSIEPVKKNLSVLKENCPKATAILGDARNLKKIENNSQDLVLLFGPLYHLPKKEDRVAAIKEAVRVLKSGGILMNMFLMNEYAVLTHAFKEGAIGEALEQKQIDETFKIKDNEDGLYNYSRIKDINELKKASGLARKELVAIGCADYMRETINKLDATDFEAFKEYMIYLSDKKEMLGASSHCLDILEKK